MSQQHNIPITIFAAILTLSSSACFDDTQITGDGETDGGNTPINDGVYIYCLNESELNVWYKLINGVATPFHGNYDLDPPLNACIGQANMGVDFNLVDDWDDEYYGYPEFDAEIRQVCTERCVVADDGEFWTSQAAICLDTNWSGHAVTQVSYDPAMDGADCEVAVVNPNIIGDPDVSEIDWNEGVGSPLNLPLNCSLLDDCVDEFDANIDEWALAFASGGVLGFITPDTRGASFHAITGVIGTSIALDMDFGTGSGYDDEHTLVGHAEYSPSYCGDSTCPFYLATFEAANRTDEWEIYLDVSPVVSENKEISSIDIQMLQSTLAVWRPSTGRVAFPSGSLIFQVSFDLSSDTCTGSCSHFGDGAYSRTLVNSEVVFGTFDSVDGGLTLDYSFPIVGGEATLAVGLGVDDGHPPEAAINLGAEPRCNHANGYELTVSEDDSTDADSDLDYTVWYVDGVVRPSGYVIPVGIHTIDLLAVDDRGAYDLAGSQALEVIQGPACL